MIFNGEMKTCPCGKNVEITWHGITVECGGGETATGDFYLCHGCAKHMARGLLEDVLTTLGLPREKVIEFFYEHR